MLFISAACTAALDVRVLIELPCVAELAIKLSNSMLVPLHLIVGMQWQYWLPLCLH
jgi:hypothetical protein